jgi:hypothetical protein
LPANRRESRELKPDFHSKFLILNSYSRPFASIRGQKYFPFDQRRLSVNTPGKARPETKKGTPAKDARSFFFGVSSLTE